jgi:hypothetical protein
VASTRPAPSATVKALRPEDLPAEPAPVVYKPGYRKPGAGQKPPGGASKPPPAAAEDFPRNPYR